jgi:hypothetical protein
MIESLLALIITVIALGWMIWRLWRSKPKNWLRLGTVLILMILVMYAVEVYLPDYHRVQIWFGAITSLLMALATYVETEPTERN